MSAPPTIEIDDLVKPVPGDTQGGVPLPEPVRSELERLRKPAAAAADPGGGKRPAPDFRAIIGDATDALTNTSKDIALVARLAEALTRVHGAAGLRDGLRLLLRVSTDCWDWVHPLPKEGGDYAVRGNRYKWLNAADSGAEFPQTVQMLQVVRCGTEGFCYFDTLDPGRAAELEAGLSNVSKADLVANHSALTDAAAALAELSVELKKRMGDEDAPDFSGSGKLNLGTAIRNSLTFLEEVAGKRGIHLGPEVAAPAGGGDQPAAGGTATGGGAPARVGESRDVLYAQIEQIANVLKRIEPHSPVPFLLERCVRLGRMPFPELMRSVLGSSGTVSELDKLLGLVEGG